MNPEPVSRPQPSRAVLDRSFLGRSSQGANSPGKSGGFFALEQATPGKCEPSGQRERSDPNKQFEARRPQSGPSPSARREGAQGDPLSSHVRYCLERTPFHPLPIAADIESATFPSLPATPRLEFTPLISNQQNRPWPKADRTSFDARFLRAVFGMSGNFKPTIEANIQTRNSQNSSRCRRGDSNPHSVAGSGF